MKKQIHKKYNAEFKAEVVREILKEEKSLSQISSEYKVHPTQLNRWKEIVIGRKASLFEKDKKAEEEKAEEEKKVEELYGEIGRLTTQMNWLKKNLAYQFSREKRKEMMEQERELTIKEQANLLSLSRASIYYKVKEVSETEVKIKYRIDEIYTKWPFYGSRRIGNELNKEGIKINRKTVQRYMREMAIEGISPGPNLSKRNLEHKVYPYLLRNKEIKSVNEVWGIDITYIKLRTGWMYLVAILDLYSRYVVSWELEQTLEIDFVLSALDKALKKAKPEIINSDQGSHFTSPQYIDRLKEASIKISMDGKGRALDNIFVERLWRSVKYEEVYLNDYLSPREARISLNLYLQFYNFQRPHQSLNYLTPAQVYFHFT